MKIVHMTSVHGRYDTRIFKKECVSLKKKYDTVYLLVADGNNNEKHNNIDIIDVGSYKNRLYRIIVAPIKIYIRALKLRAQIYHYHDFELAIVSLLLKISGKKVIYDVHEDLPNDILYKPWINKNIRNTLSYFVNILELFIAKKMDAIITPTDYIAKRFRVVNNKTITIKNFPILININKQKRIEGDYICYVSSNFIEVRGIKELIYAMENIKTKLFLVGNMPNTDYINNLKKEPGWKRVKEFGLIKQEEVFKIIENSICGINLCYPTKTYMNAIPTKIFEYMMFGIPVISSNLPIEKEIIEGNNCGLCVNPFSSEEIEGAINFIINNRTEAERMGCNGISAIKNRYSWEKEELKLFDIYSNI